MKKSAFIESQLPALALLVMLVLTFVPFLGETLFHTKGEPREAVVALSMLQSGDWILPVSNGGDIPYKPPMFAWVIACFGWLNGGVVTEYISRFPSAIAAIVMIMTGFVVARRNVGTRTAIIMAVVTATSFEVHRAATNCRVDMLLTMFMVCGTYSLYSRFVRKGSLFSWLGVLMFSGAVLTKGPVGVVLPLIVMWTFALLRGERWWRATLECVAIFLLSLVLPALWYYAAYMRGGDNFLELVIEENIGRMTGTMSYESHENPWWYNIVTIIAGMLPYTLLALMALVPMYIRRDRNMNLGQRLRNLRNDPWQLFMALLAAIVFVFYCIPSSKRSVYLLPMYPVLAYYVAVIAENAIVKAKWAVRGFGWTIAVVGILVAIAMFAVRYSTFGVEKSAGMFVNAIRTAPLGITACLCISLALVLGVRTICAILHGSAGRILATTMLCIVALYWSFSAFYQPVILNAKSEKPVAMALRAAGYGKDKPVSGWLSDKLMRFYVIDFYLDDKVRSVRSPHESDGALLIYRGDLDYFEQLYSRRLDYILLREFVNPSGKAHRDILLIQPVAKKEKAKISDGGKPLSKKSSIEIVGTPEGLKIIDKNTGKPIDAKKISKNGE